MTQNEHLTLEPWTLLFRSLQSQESCCRSHRTPAKPSAQNPKPPKTETRNVMKTNQKTQRPSIRATPQPGQIPVPTLGATPARVGIPMRKGHPRRGRATSTGLPRFELRWWHDRRRLEGNLKAQYVQLLRLLDASGTCFLNCSRHLLWLI